MTALSADPRAVFLGQCVKFPGTGMYESFADVPDHMKIEMPVFENVQLGMSIGLSLTGAMPISVFPRINFLLCAMDALVLHLDAIPKYSAYRPKIIIRTAVAHATPLDPGPQHLSDHSYAIEKMLTTVVVTRLRSADLIIPQYRAALDRPESTLLVEYTDSYDTE